MRNYLVCVFLFVASPVWAQHGPHADLIAKAQQDLRAAGQDLSGDCGAFKVTNLAVTYIRASGDTQAGLLFKTAGSGCASYGNALFAKDAIVYPNGEVYDTIIASGAMGGNGGPTWNKSDNRSDVVCPCPPGLWRDPVSPTLYGFGGAAPQPVQTSTPQPTNQNPIVIAAPGVDLLPVIQAINASHENLYEQAERIFAAQEAEYKAQEAHEAAHEALLVQHAADTKSFIDKVGSFLADGKTITAIVTGIGTYLATHYETTK